MNFIKKASAVLSSVLTLTTISFSAHAGLVKGDANSDGQLTVRDAAFIAKCLAEKKGVSSSADFDGDGKVTIRDAAGSSTPEATAQQWINSEEHYKNIINPNFTDMGIGYASGSTYGHYWVQLFR